MNTKGLPMQLPRLTSQEQQLLQTFNERLAVELVFVKEWWQKYTTPTDQDALVLMRIAAETLCRCIDLKLQESNSTEDDIAPGTYDRRQIERIRRGLISPARCAYLKSSPAARYQGDTNDPPRDPATGH